MNDTEALRAALQAAREARNAVPMGTERSALNVALDRLDVALSTAAALAPQPAASGEPVAFDAEGFRAFVLRELPDDTIIGKGAWWADHLTKCAQWFVKPTAAPQPAPAPVASGEPAQQQPTSPDVRAALLFALYHHQGSSSKIGQPIRHALGIAQYAPLDDEQCAEAARVDLALRRATAQPAPARVPLTEAQIKTMKEAAADQGLTGIAPSLHLARAVEAWHGIPAAPTAQQEPARAKGE